MLYHRRSFPTALLRRGTCQELVDEYLGFCADFGAEDEAVCFSIWGASNGHVIREHVHRTGNGKVGSGKWQSRSGVFSGAVVWRRGGAGKAEERRRHLRSCASLCPKASEGAAELKVKPAGAAEAALFTMALGQWFACDSERFPEHFQDPPMSARMRSQRGPSSYAAPPPGNAIFGGSPGHEHRFRVFSWALGGLGGREPTSLLYGPWRPK